MREIHDIYEPYLYRLAGVKWATADIPTKVIRGDSRTITYTVTLK